MSIKYGMGLVKRGLLLIKYLLFGIPLLAAPRFPTAQNLNSHGYYPKLTGSSICFRPDLFSDHNVQLRLEALSGDQRAGAFIAGYYRDCSFNRDLVRYWGMIAADDGGSYNEFSYALALSNYPNQKASSLEGIENNLRSLFWAQRASNEEKIVLDRETETGFIFDITPARYYYWRDVSRIYRRNKWIFLEAQELEVGPPVFFANVRHDGSVEMSVESSDVSTSFYKRQIEVQDFAPLVINALLGEPLAAEFLAKNEPKFPTIGVDLPWRTMELENGTNATQVNLNRSDKTRCSFWNHKKIIEGISYLDKRLSF